MITMTIGRKEHIKPSDVEYWCLPDIVLMYSSYIDEAREMEEMTKDMEKS